MALSFEESKKLYAQQAAAPATFAMRRAAVASDVWTPYDGPVEYPWFEDYYDDKLSTVDDNKNVSVHDSQVNISQEINSQFIPFEMMRRYDNIDLLDMALSIHFTTSDGKHFASTPVNVEYNDDKIRFAWLVDENATHIDGNLQFEIHADGAIVDSKGNSYGYRWKSKPTDKFNVLKSLCADPNCEPVSVSDDWVVEIVESVATSMAEKIAEANVGAQVEAAKQAANRAEEAASNAANVVDSKLVDYSTTAQMQEYVTQEIANADIDNKLTAYATKEYVGTVVGELGESENIVAYVNTAVQNVNVKDQLDELRSELPTKVSKLENDAGYLTEHQSLEGYATESYVQEQIDTIPDVDLTDYAKSEDVYTKAELDNKLTNLNNYATKDDVNAVATSLETVRGNTVTNATNILTVQNDIAAIQSSLSSLKGDNQNLIIQYDEVGSVLHLYEKDENGDITITDGDEQIKVKELYSTIITGAGGGNGSLVSTVKMNLRADGADSFTILHGSALSLNYHLSTRKAKETQDAEGNDVTIYEEAVIPGDITLTLYRDNVYVTHFTVTKTSSEVQSGSIDISDYIRLDEQVFTVTASYVEKLGADGETITVRSSEDWAVNAIQLKLADMPDSTWEATPKFGSTTFSYTPIGALEKTIYFKIDDKEPEIVKTELNGTTSLEYTIPPQSHGVHTLRVWCEGNVGGKIIPSETYEYILMFVEEGNKDPIIRIKAPATLEQYSSANICYNILDPSNPIVESATIYDEEGTLLSSPTNLTSAEQSLEFRPLDAQTKTITIKYKETLASVTIEVTKFPYEINAVTGNLMVDFVPTGRKNSDADYKVFKNNAYTVEKDSETGEEVRKEIPITWAFSDNFDWVNGGWKTDKDASGNSMMGTEHLCIKAGTSVTINYNLFGTDGVIAKQDANGDYNIAGTGKEFKLIFKTTNVVQAVSTEQANVTWLKCIDTADNNALGIRMEPQNAYIDSSLGTLEIPYVDDDIIEFDMNIVPLTKFVDNKPDWKAKTIPMIMTYEDGTPVQPKVISSASTSFKQDKPQPITIGSEYCDVHIYRMKVYERHLDDKEIITNFIADARSGAEMAKRYVRNDIYPIANKQKITPESVAAACPDLKVYVLSAPRFTNDKKNKIDNTTIRQIHNTGTKENPEYDPKENWIATGATHNGQGTSSNEYGYSGRNLEFNMEDATITLGDNTTVVTEIQLSPTSYPTNYLNFKINIASSENANNALLQKRYDRYLPYTSVASLIDDRKKNSMEFFNCVVFIQETDTAQDENGVYTAHREFNDTDIHFYGIGNIGDSKNTDYTRVNDADDVNEFCVEIKDWNRYLSSFPTDTMVSTLYTDEDGVQLVRFEDLLIDTNLGENGIIYEKDNQGNYYHSTDAIVDKTKTYYIDVLENDYFDDTYTYEFRYLQKEWEEDDGEDYKEKNKAFQEPLRQKWIEFYRFVTRDLTTNGVEDPAKVEAWKSEFSNWFITDSALYYYLYTLRYTMVDNRAKNTFWHWGKHYLTFDEATARGISLYDEKNKLITDASNLPSEFYDANGNKITNINATAAGINTGYRMEFWAYDNDTALGIDNAGKLEISFGVEDADVDAAGVPYFRAHDSLVFVRIAKYFADELEQMWHKTENPEIKLPEGVGQKVFDSTSFIDEFDKWQNEFPEELWRLDYERKYKRTYVGGTGAEWDNALPQTNKSNIESTRFLAEMMNGRKKYQRRCFERNQEIYMSSKFKGEVNLGDTITLRGTGRPTGKTVPFSSALYVTPFSKMYVNLYNSTDKCYYHEKHEAGERVGPIPYPGTSLDFLYIRGGSQIQSLGDLSPMYLQTAELTPGAKLQTITLGNATTGYSNDSLKTLQIGEGNKLLEELDIRNLRSLDNTVLPVSNIPSLKRVYAQGSNISEATFANNGLLEDAYLPETITRLDLRNLHYLKTIDLASYENLLHLVVMDCSMHKDSIVTISDLILDMINQARGLKTLRVNNINWTFNNIDVLERLYNLITTPDSPEVVLAGAVSVPVIGTHDLNKYGNVWPKLTIKATIKDQFKVTFINDNGDILDVQYIEQFADAVDPITRDKKPIPTPTKDSTAQYDYTFAGWNGALTNITADRVIKATYTPTRRTYTVQYVSKGTIIKTEADMPYGSNSVYDGSIPTYTAEEPYAFYLFNGWDKDGYVDGDKVINAVYDSCSYSEGYFVNKELVDMRPVELYMMIRLNALGSISLTDYVEAKDSVKIQLGNDFSYTNVTEKVLVDSPVEFTGSNYVDTGVKLFSEDRDFVLAIDCKMSNSSVEGVLAQCFSEFDTTGFRLSSSSGTKLAWGSDSDNSLKTNCREMIVIRHRAGETGAHVYISNVAGAESYYVPLNDERDMTNDYPLVFGANKVTAEGTKYNQYGRGIVYWSKLWYADLGDDVCRKLVSWPHEEMNFEVCCEKSGELKYYYVDKNTTSSLTFIASNLLSQPVRMRDIASNSGGWAAYSLNTYLNKRVLAAFPDTWQQLIKPVQVTSSIGDKSTSTSTSTCSIFIPSIAELGVNTNAAPYASEGTMISHMVNDAQRICCTDDGIARVYWTRSPSIGTSDPWPYVYGIKANGEAQSVTTLTNETIYVRCMISM